MSTAVKQLAPVYVVYVTASVADDQYAKGCHVTVLLIEWINIKLTAYFNITNVKTNSAKLTFCKQKAYTSAVSSVLFI